MRLVWMTLCFAGLAASACQVRGVIGSNETAAIGSADGGAPGTGGATSAVAENTGLVTSAGGGGGTGGTSGATQGEDSSGEDSASIIFDVQALDVPAVCAPPSMQSCERANTWWAALGLGCDEHGQGDFVTGALEAAMSVHKGGLGSGPFEPHEGDTMVILSTGLAADVPLTPSELIDKDPWCDPKVCPSTVLAEDRRLVLPEPLSVHRVSDERDCNDDPSLIGQGDCSNSLSEHWARGDGALDYSELRMRLEVPPNTDAFSYDFAFFSSEYPLFVAHDDEAYNDMYIAWLESENWTGNISFDGDHNPITVHSVFLDHRSRSDVCPTCEAPELAGFSMEEHAGTKWLTTVAPVVAGEEIELIFAVLDLSDAQFDSFVLLDNFEWTCSDGPPVTWAG